MSRLATRLAAALVPAVLLLPAAAHAASLTVADGAGDAQAINMETAFSGPLDGDAEAPLFFDAPDETSTDVVGTTIDHAEKRLTLTLRFRDLVDTKGHVVSFRIFTPRGRYDLAVLKQRGRTIAELDTSSDVIVLNEGNSATIGNDRPCRTVRGRYDLATDSLTASVPTSCIGSPTWVQVAAGASRTAVTPVGDGSVNLAGFVDDAFRGGVSLRSMGRSAKVRRG